MSERAAVEGLQRLGLDNYEAQVFVALQRLGGGTAQDVAKNSDVPRSQVYGAADGLAARGLVEVVEATPKEYRPVTLDTAREVLTDRMRRERERTFDSLESLREERAGPTGDGVSTLRGHQPIDRRLAEMVDRADDRVVYVFPGDRSVPARVDDSLRARANAGVDVTLVTDAPAVGDAYADDDAVAVVVDTEEAAGYTGRVLLVDDATILISVLLTDDDTEPMDEMALWTAETKIARILGEFIYAGMERVVERGED